MTKLLSDTEKAVLVGVLQDRDHWASQDLDAPGLRWGMERGAHRLRIEAARRGEIRLNPEAWLDHEPTPAERRALSRAYERLERAGLLVRVAEYGGRTTCLKLTDAGEKAARELLKIRDTIAVNAV